ncbi:MAG: hypothetical protein Q4B42_04035, partial [Oscillospiraceae bacterium]|nr:hypothetical protein [Oscillospiraceae bacterium]
MLLSFLKQNKFKTALIFIAFAACSAVLLLPGVALGHDAHFHIIRIDAIVQGLKNGEFLQKIYPLLYEGYGYPSPLYYGDLFLVVPALLNLLGLKLLACYKLFLALIIAASLLTGYISASYILRSEAGALVCSLLYTTCAYFAFNLYLRAAIGESQAYVFLPLVLMGLYSLLFDEDIKIWPLVLGFGGCILVHIISSLILSVFTLLTLLVFSRRLFEKRRLRALLKAAGITAALTGFFAFPLLEQYFISDIYSDVMNPLFSPGDRALLIQDLLLNTSGTPVMYPGLVLPGLGLIFAAAPVLRLFSIIKNRRLKPFLDFCGLLGLTALLCCTNIFPWHALTPYVYIVQFPWRLFSFASLFLSLFSGGVVSGFKLSKKAALAIGALALAAGLASFVPTAVNTYYLSVQNDLLYEGLDDCEFIDSNYLHANNDDEFFEPLPDEQLAEESGLDIYFSREYAKLYLHLNETPAEDSAFEVPLVYCHGYSAVETGSGLELETEPGERGFVQLKLPAGTAKGVYLIS